jgi:hypothetical protein
VDEGRQVPDGRHPASTATFAYVSVPLILAAAALRRQRVFGLTGMHLAAHSQIKRTGGGYVLI